MFRKRSVRKPSDAFLRDFQRKFSGVTAIPYTLGASTVPEQPVQWNDSVGIQPGLLCNPTLLPSPDYSSSPPSRQNCSCSVLKGGKCAVPHDHQGDEYPAQGPSCHFGAGPWLLGSTYAVPQDLHGHQAMGLQYQGYMGDFASLPPHSPREISPADSRLDQSSITDETQAAYHSQQPPRFQATLHASTATYDPSRQLPVTYLNRRQGYKISIIDTVPPVSLPHPVRYRTHFRIAFDNQEQRANPVAAWRLWRDNRGLNEASRSDGQLRAVEFVDVMSNVIRGRPPGSQVALESSSLDGFSIVWLADTQSGHAGCEAHILFNFLSTDFTLSKGVQGIPLRLYAKTELITPDASAPPALSTAEINYCRVKLFRDHGSERKLANDAVKLKKAIDKVQQRIDNLESGTVQGRVNTGKRKQGKSPAATRQPMEPSLTTTHDFSASDDLRKVLSSLEAVMSSSQPRSALWLRGDVQDDPDRFPVMLSDEGPARGATGSSSPTNNRTQNHDHNCNHAVACFYILRRVDGKVEDYYHAMYLDERTLPDLLRHLSQAYQLGPNSVSHAIRVNAAGLRIVVDDDVVQEIPHGQDMIAEFSQDADCAIGSSPRFRATLFF